jgi:hypothetical protein
MPIEGLNPLTVGDIQDAIQELPDDTEVIFGCPAVGGELLFYRFKMRGKRLLQIQLNEPEELGQ